MKFNDYMVDEIFIKFYLDELKEDVYIIKNLRNAAKKRKFDFKNYKTVTVKYIDNMVSLVNEKGDYINNTNSEKRLGVVIYNKGNVYSYNIELQILVLLIKIVNPMVIKFTKESEKFYNDLQNCVVDKYNDIKLII